MSYYPPPSAAPSSGLATASMVLGICGFVTCGITSVLAVVLGHVAEVQTRHNAMAGRGNAVAGLVLGYVVLAPWVIFLWVPLFMGAASIPFVGTTST